MKVKSNHLTCVWRGGKQSEKTTWNLTNNDMKQEHKELGLTTCKLVCFALLQKKPDTPITAATLFLQASSPPFCADFQEKHLLKLESRSRKAKQNRTKQCGPGPLTFFTTNTHQKMDPATARLGTGNGTAKVEKWDHRPFLLKPLRLPLCMCFQLLRKKVQITPISGQSGYLVLTEVTTTICKGNDLARQLLEAN